MRLLLASSVLLSFLGINSILAEQPRIIPLIHLLSNPEAYNGKEIKTIGCYAPYEREVWLCLDEQHARNRIPIGILPIEFVDQKEFLKIENTDLCFVVIKGKAKFKNEKLSLEVKTFNDIKPFKTQNQEMADYIREQKGYTEGYIQALKDSKKGNIESIESLEERLIQLRWRIDRFELGDVEALYREPPNINK